MSVRARLIAAVVCIAAIGSIGGILMRTHTWGIVAQLLWILPFVLAMLTGVAKTTTV